MMFSVHKATKGAVRLMRPHIEERLAKSAEYGRNYEGKPVGVFYSNYDRVFTALIQQHDLISWLTDEAPPQHRNVPDISFRVLFVHLAAIHTTSLVSLLHHLIDMQSYTSGSLTNTNTDYNECPP